MIMGACACWLRVMFFAGKVRFPEAGTRYTCEAYGRADRLLLLGDLNGFEHHIHTASPLSQQLFNAVRTAFHFVHKLAWSMQHTQILVAAMMQIIAFLTSKVVNRLTYTGIAVRMELQPGRSPTCISAGLRG